MPLEHLKDGQEKPEKGDSEKRHHGGEARAAAKEGVGRPPGTAAIQGQVCIQVEVRLCRHGSLGSLGPSFPL